MTLLLERKVVDLTHALSSEIPAWNGKSDFELRTLVNYQDCTPPDLFRIQKICGSASLGTHIDAPAHVIPGGRTIEQLTLEELVTDVCVVDVSDEEGEEREVGISAVERFEQKHGMIPPNALAIIYTGWDRHWENPEKYHNEHVFPSLDLHAAEMLLSRNIAGIGIDTFSCDTGNEGFPIHRLILGADKYLIENVANARHLPAKGAKIVALPQKVAGATEAPLRLIAFL